MAGVKGRSGGPRSNAGGARAGSGRKPKAPKESANEVVSQKGGETEAPPPEVANMVEFLEQVALGLRQASNIQVRAAIAAAQYKNTKSGDGGKKEGVQKGAEVVAGRFGLRRVQ